nr:DUF4214 domain-containing protein [Nitrosomonas nitrosa]
MNQHLLCEQNFTNLEQLRAYHNERFIRLAYHAILGREVDTESLRYYLSLVGQNLSQAEFIIALCTSPEAQSRWQSNKVQSKEDIDNKLTEKYNILTSRYQQLPDELKEHTSYARNIYFQLKSALAINSVGGVL